VAGRNALNSFNTAGAKIYHGKTGSRSELTAQSAPVLLAPKVIAGTEETEHPGYFAGTLALGGHFCQSLIKSLGEVLFGRLFPFLFGSEPGANFSQLAVVQPVTGARGAFIYFHLLFHAEKMSHHYYAIAFRAHSSPGVIHHNAFIPFDIQQTFACGLMRFTHFLQFELIEPDSSAPAYAGIHGDIAGFYLL
jgi:hypothetical protein